jgi:hypothetical protein
MSIKFLMTRDIGGFNGFGIQPTYDIHATSLAANTAQSVTVPSNYGNWIAIFTYTPGANIWVSFSGTAAVATSSFTSGISVLNPAGRAVVAGQVISFITSDTTAPFVCVEFQIIAPYVN